ncbi:uncharacterized protein LOC112017593 [Quercus suber]|uniref:uncharacterized protein LOC112017593 n=1 Tax=Quercus suber TaxID=58331 RepID=UPI000CE27904|nr:uncharacterized protein LOC112017593 [Quercus suber]
MVEDGIRWFIGNEDKVKIWSDKWIPNPETYKSHVPTLWRPPPLGWYKTNVDGAVFKEQGQCGIGVVVWNDKSQIMGALSKTLPYPLGALDAKAKAAEIGIIFSWELGLREIILEGDSQIVMNAIASHDPGPIKIQQLVTDIKSWVPKFRAWKTSFTRREGNKAAHLMAKHAKEISECTI